VPGAGARLAAQKVECIGRRFGGGKGPVVVLIHGILGTRRSWEQLVSLLEQDFTVIAPDLLGLADALAGQDAAEVPERAPLEQDTFF